MPDKHPLHVLIIDDEPIIRLLIRDYLEDSGYLTREAENGKHGLEVFRETPPDVVLVDLRMPEVDGLDVLQAITREAPEIPVIVVSGTGRMKDVIEALRLGAWDYITKPIEDMEMLEHAIGKSLERARLLRDNRLHQEHLEEQVRQRTHALQQSEARYRQLSEELEERVKQRTAELEFANKELKDFAYVVSHDLKAPLRGISHLAEWLVEDYAHAFDDKGREMIDLLSGRVKRMDSLIDGILEYSRVDRIVHQAEQIDLQALLKAIIDSLAPPEHISITIDTTLPVIVADKSRMIQLFQNLLDNAINFMDKPEGHITIRCEENEHRWTFGIADNGPGIDPAYHTRIFQIFHTLAPKDECESTGVGLTLVKKIVEFYEGRIWLASQPGKGSTFFFTLLKHRVSQAVEEEGEKE